MTLIFRKTTLRADEGQQGAGTRPASCVLPRRRAHSPATMRRRRSLTGSTMSKIKAAARPRYKNIILEIKIDCIEAARPLLRTPELGQLVQAAVELVAVASTYAGDLMWRW